ncbi:MAG: ADP-forming succinate--CoA ligase subunit beta [Gammaproteobacteria bacterium]|nr:ADP-forming succinate--CoA ligase subunit beta [Gammaproteobacteria bacterium]
MNLHEYQSKQLFANYGMPVPRGQVVDSAAAAAAAAEELGGNLWVVKAQVHAGGRGKAGGVELCKTIDDVKKAAEKMLGMTLVTHQTGPEGLPVNQLLIEAGSDIERELYLSVVVDRDTSRITFMASTEGGMDIEEVAEKTPEKIFKVHVNPSTGLMPYQMREMAFGLGITKEQQKDFGKVVQGLYNMFVEKDASLVEINPLIITTDNRVVVLDAKVNLDDSAMFRHKDLAEMRDPTQEDEKENIAHEHELNYVQLDGNIACMVNGAGLAMATMDLIKLHGGEPANFLDVGGGATKERVTEAFKLILSNEDVEGILVNIFGGIVRCDLIAEGILAAVKEVGVNVPVVARLEGTNVDKGKELLANSDVAVQPADDLTDAAKKIIAAVAK